MPTELKAAAQAEAERARGLLLRLAGSMDPDVQLEPFDVVQSLNNRNWVTREPTQGVQAVLRIADVTCDPWLGIDRVEEERIARAAADAGIGPTVLAADPASGLLLTQLIEGAPWVPNRGGIAALMRLGTAVRTLQALRTTVCTPRGIFERIRGLLAAAVELGGLEGSIQRYEDWLHETETHRSATGVQEVVGHNDLWPNNTLDDGHRLRLVDWEFSGLSDPLYDLATIRLSVDSARIPTARLLALFGGAGSNVEITSVEDVERMTCAVQLFELGWSGVRHGLAADGGPAPGFDFASHANGMRRTVDERLESAWMRWRS